MIQGRRARIVIALERVCLASGLGRHDSLLPADSGVFH